MHVIEFTSIGIKSEVVIMEWRTPELICLETKALMCKIRVRADSSIDYEGCEPLDTQRSSEVCPELDFTETFCGTDAENMEGGEAPCMALTMCVEVGPLFGCLDDLACSNIVTILR